MSNVKIGVTERGDAALDLSWVDKQGSIDGLILITKNVTNPAFKDAVLHKLTVPAVIHCTCTGMGGTPVEPNVPHTEKQLLGLFDLIQAGFPAERCVIRIDPIVHPLCFEYVMMTAMMIFPDEMLKKLRFRLSLIDIYPHTKERCKKALSCYTENGKTRTQSLLSDIAFNEGFQLPKERVREIAEIVTSFSDFHFETCAEPDFKGSNIEHIGCVSMKDLYLMGIDVDDEKNYINPQGRSGCLCLSCKRELLSTKHRCGHGCLYCYWKD